MGFQTVVFNPGPGGPPSLHIFMFFSYQGIDLTNELINNIFKLKWVWWNRENSKMCRAGGPSDSGLKTSQIKHWHFFLSEQEEDMMKNTEGEVNRLKWPGGTEKDLE